MFNHFAKINTKRGVKEISYESKQEIKVQEMQTRQILRVFG